MQGSASLTRGYVGGDFLIAEDALPLITREFGTLSNATANAIVYPAGTFLNLPTAGGVATEVQVGQENTWTGLLLEKTTVLPNSTGTPCAIVTRAPVGVNYQMLPTGPVAGGTYTAATIKTRAVTNGIVLRFETTGTGTQVQTT